MCFMLSVSGGVCEVQNRTCVVPELHPASGAADWSPVLQAVAKITRETSEALSPRPGSNVIAFSSVAVTVDPRLLPGRPSTSPGRERAGAGPPIAPPQWATTQTNIVDMTCQDHPLSREYR